MNVIMAPDSFKNALSSSDVATALARGWRAKRPFDTVQTFPLADGGEGFCRALKETGRWSTIRLKTHDPLFRPIEAEALVSQDGESGVVEMAAASGLELLQKEELNPLNTTTFGTGEMMMALLARGVKTLLVGLGGSATNDGGAGVLQALGGRFYDGEGRLISSPMTGGNLLDVQEIDLTEVRQKLRGVKLEIACDVTNPLCGPQGAAEVFAPQKGATPDVVQELDRALRHYAQTGWQSDGEFPGAGAAGGCGFALKMLGGTLRPGAELVMTAAGFSDALPGADLVITGEGCSDEQTLHGKLCAAVAKEAAKHGVPVILASGALRGDVAQLEKVFAAVVSIGRGAEPLPDALSQTSANLERMGRNLARMCSLVKDL